MWRTIAAAVAVTAASGAESCGCRGNATLPPAGISMIFLENPQHRYQPPTSNQTGNGKGVSPFVRSPAVARSVIDVGMNNGADFTLPGIVNGLGVLSFEAVPKTAYKTFKAMQAVGKKFGRPVEELKIEPGELPDARTIARARAVLEGHGGGAALVAGGASDAAAALPVFMPKRKTGSLYGSLAQTNMPRKDKGDKAGTVAAVPIDALLGTSPLPSVGLLKVDAQGWEAHVFRGARALLCTPGGVRYIEFEFSALMIANAAGDVKSGGGDDDDVHAPVTMLEQLRASGRMCFALKSHVHGPHLMDKRVTPHRRRGVVDFTQFARQLRRPLAPSDERAACGGLGCAAEIVCVEMCSDEPLERAVARLLNGVQHESAMWPEEKQRAYERQFSLALREELAVFDGARGARWHVSGA